MIREIREQDVWEKVNSVWNIYLEKSKVIVMIKFYQLFLGFFYFVNL